MPGAGEKMDDSYDDLDKLVDRRTLLQMDIENRKISHDLLPAALNDLFAAQAAIEKYHRKKSESSLERLIILYQAMFLLVGLVLIAVLVAHRHFGPTPLVSDDLRSCVQSCISP